MNIILDLAVVGILAFKVIVGYKKGFIKGLMGFVSGILALAIAFFVSPTVAGVLDNSLVRPAIASSVEEKIVSMNPGDGDLMEFLYEAPEELKAYCSGIGVDMNQLDTYLPAEGMEGDNVTVLSSVSNALAAPLSNMISSVLSYILVYIAALLLLKLVTNMLDGLFKLPILRIPNQILGAAVGLITGVITCFVICSVVGLVLPYLAQGENPLFANVTADKTLLFRFFCGFDAVAQLLGTILK